MRYKTIELFGISGSGKTSFERKLRRYLILNNIKVLNKREIITKFAQNEIKFNIIDLITLKYFQFVEKVKTNKNLIQKKNLVYFNKKINLKANKPYLNYFRRRYIKICKQLYTQYCKKNKNTRNIINRLLSNIDIQNRNLLSFWFYEMFAAYYLFEKKKINNAIFLTDEGFVQRNFLILYSKIKRKNNFLNKFYSICPKPNFCFYLKTKKDKILNTHKYRKRKNIQMWLEIDQIRNFVNFEKKIHNLFKDKIPYIIVKRGKYSISDFKKILK